MKLFRPFAIAASLALSVTAAHAKPPEVVVTIKPIHALVSSVMKGIGTPYLIVRGAGSPHDFQLKPSVARQIAKANVIFWIGEDLETFMEKAIETLGKKATVVELAEAPGIKLLPTREGGLHESDDHDADHKHGKKHADKHTKKHDHSKDHDAKGKAGEHKGHGHHHGNKDMHLWLDIDNAKAIVRAAQTALVKADPANAGRYRKNAAATIARLDVLDRDLRRQLATVKSRRFIVFHDAYQYFEKRYALAAAGSITVDPSRPPGAKRVASIREHLREEKVVCAFSEPQFPEKFVATIITGTKVRKGALDPLGVAGKPGAGAYEAMMRQMAGNFVRCLSKR